MSTEDRSNRSPDDATAFHQLFAQNQRRVFGYILTLLPRLSDAEEVFQQTCVVILGLNYANSISSNGTFVAANAGGSGIGWSVGGAAVYNTVTQATTTIGADGNCWAVNSNGTAVGDTTIGGTRQPFVYSGGSTYALADHLAFPLPAGDTLIKAVAINDNGVIAAEMAEPIATGGYYPHVLLLTAPGDANFDGKVDINDLTKVLTNYNQTAGASWGNGDFNNDGKVDINDLTIVLAHYNQSLGSSAAGSLSAVPEPGALGLLAAGLIGLLSFTWRRHAT